MENGQKPNILIELLDEMVPAPEHLVSIFRGLGRATIDAEEVRLRERFLDIATRLTAINEIRGV